MQATTACKHCDTICDDSFCPHCGQATSTSRIMLKEITMDLVFSFVKVNRGFLFTAKELSLQPGKAVQRYLAGHRIEYYVPHKYLFLLGAITAFLSVRYQFFTDTNPIIHSFSIETNAFLSKFFQYANEYTTLINVVTTPVFALFSFFLFHRTYNYAEHLVLNVYITGHQLLLLIVLAPLFEIDSARPMLLSGYTLISVIYNVWVYKQFFETHSWAGLLRICLAIALAYISQFILNLAVFLLIRPWQ